MWHLPETSCLQITIAVNSKTTPCSNKQTTISKFLIISMKQLAVFSVIALMLSLSMVDCSKKGDEEPDDLADTTFIAPVKFIDTLPPGTALRHGTLHTEDDFTRIKTALAGNQEPWVTGYNVLKNNS